MITLNGQSAEIKPGMTVTELLTEKKFREALVAVEHNGKILKKEDYGNIVLQDGDVVEVVSFMGGG